MYDSNAADQRGLVKYNVVYNPALVRDAGPELFEPSYWHDLNSATQAVGGRGAVLFIRDGKRHWVLRHYRRGGLIGKLLEDQYLWLGAEATRSFREWRLLAHLHALGLPVPTPVAARYVRSGLVYRADLLTVEIESAQTLTEKLKQGALDHAMWQRLGTTLARFHAVGAQHADLNANNILINTQGQIFVLDFDRGRLRQGTRWSQSVLKRLRRSLDKLNARYGLHFGEEDWQALLKAHDVRLLELRTRVA